MPDINSVYQVTQAISAETDKAEFAETILNALALGIPSALGGTSLFMIGKAFAGALQSAVHESTGLARDLWHYGKMGYGAVVKTISERRGGPRPDGGGGGVPGGGDITDYIDRLRAGQRLYFKDESGVYKMKGIQAVTVNGPSVFAGARITHLPTGHSVELDRAELEQFLKGEVNFETFYQEKMNKKRNS